MRPLKLSTKPFCIIADRRLLANAERELARRDLVPFDLMVSALIRKDRVRGQSGSVVGDDHFWFPASFDDGRQFPSHTLARNRRVWDCTKAFTSDVIDDIQNAKPATTGELVMHEVQRPRGSTRIGAAPASCSCKIPMIWSSEKLCRFIVRPFLRSDSNSKWRNFLVADQGGVVVVFANVTHVHSSWLAREFG